MIGVTVQFHDETLPRPDGVHLDPGDPGVHVWIGEPRLATELQESLLELGPGGRGHVATQRPRQAALAPVPATALEQPFRRAEVEAVESVGRVECPIDVPLADHLREIQQCPGDGRDGDAVVDARVLGVQAPREVERDAARSGALAPGRCHVDPSRVPVRQPQVDSGAAMTEEGAGTAREDRREPTSLGAEMPVTDGLHAGVQAMEPPRTHPRVDPAPAYPQPGQLPVRHHPVLPTRHPCDPHIWSI